MKIRFSSLWMTLLLSTTSFAGSYSITYMGQTITCTDSFYPWDKSCSQVIEEKKKIILVNTKNHLDVVLIKLNYDLAKVKPATQSDLLNESCAQYMQEANQQDMLAESLRKAWAVPEDDSLESNLKKLINIDKVSIQMKKSYKWKSLKDGMDKLFDNDFSQVPNADSINWEPLVKNYCKRHAQNSLWEARLAARRYIQDKLRLQANHMLRLLPNQENERH